MIFAIVEWWLVFNLGIAAMILGPAKRRYHNNVLPFRREVALGQPIDPTGKT